MSSELRSDLPYAERLRGAAPSAIREILKVTERPDVLSFAGGLPAPELFPAEALAVAAEDVLARDGSAALQYGVTEGFGPLREWVAARYTKDGAPTTADQILITHGAQQGIDLVAAAFLDAGDRVVVEDPTYLAALQAFSTYGAVPVPIPGDDQGLATGRLSALARREAPSLVYVVPSFHNPTGRTLTEPRRQELVAWAASHRVPVLADEPYVDVRFSGAPLPPMAALDPEVVVQLGTFSKTLAPGLRVGWVRAPASIRARLTVLKQPKDLHTSSFTQRVVARLLERFDFDGHLEKVRATYRSRHAAMAAALERSMPAGVRWTKPEGGLFVWLELPTGVREGEVFERALKQKIAVVPGRPFFVRAPERGHLRLSFSNRPEPAIAAGMEVLGAIVRELAEVRPRRGGGALKRLARPRSHRSHVRVDGQ